SLADFVEWRIVVSTTKNQLAFAVELTLKQADGNATNEDRVLPVEFSDNYFPIVQDPATGNSEEKIVNIRVRKALLSYDRHTDKTCARLQVKGWNVQTSVYSMYCIQ